VIIVKNDLQKKPKLLIQVRNAIRTLHYSLRTEEAYVYWIKRYIIFHNKRHPEEMGEVEIGKFLTHLAVEENVAASTQNQALCAIIFLYKNVLKVELGMFQGIQWAKKPKKLPVVFTKSEVQKVIGRLRGIHWLMAMILYGSGLRLNECVRLRVKDIDFEYRQIIVNNGKGDKDRVITLPESIIDPLKKHLDFIRELFEKDIRDGFDSVQMPYALEKSIQVLAGNLAGVLYFRQIEYQQIQGVESEEGIISMRAYCQKQ
jgi:integron integrase